MSPEELAVVLVDGSSEQRMDAARRLASLAEEAAPAALPLAKLASDTAIGQWCIAALEDMGPPSADQVEGLAKLLESDNSITAYWGATLLGRLGSDAGTVSGELLSATQHPAEEVQQRAIWALGKVGRAAAEALPKLQELAEGKGRTARLASQAIAAITS